MKKATLILTVLVSVTTKGIFAQSSAAIDPCTFCIEQYADAYLEEYLYTLDALIGGFSNCPDCVQLWQIDSAKSAAYIYAHNLDCIDTTQNSGQINLDSIMQARPYDPMLTQEESDDAVAINNWMQFNPQGLPGTLSQPGCNSFYLFTGVIKTTILQPNSIVLNISPNSGWCVTSVFGSSFVSVVNCSSVLFLPGSAFVGRDTSYYVICNSGTLMCDTGIIIVNVLSDNALLPVADFEVFCSGSFGPTSYFTLLNTSLNDTSGSAVWEIYQGPLYCDTTFFLFGDSVGGYPMNPAIQCHSYPYPSYLEICLTVSNEFGSDTKCIYSCSFTWVGIEEMKLLSVDVFPNPIDDYVIITSDEKAIGGTVQLTEVTGRIITTSTLQSKELKLATANLSPGLYLVKLTNSKGNMVTSKLIKE